MTPKFPRHAYSRCKTIKNSDTNTVENVWLFFHNTDGEETGVQVLNVANKREAWKKYYNEI
jgi:hypothetical protein